MKIIGSTSCRVGAAAGHDGDECRANLLEDHSVGCVVCETIYPKMSDRMLRVYCAIARIYGVPRVNLGSTIQPGTAAYNHACLCGFDPNLSDHVNTVFTRKGESVRLTYYRAQEVELITPDLSIGRPLSESELALMSDSMKSCVAALEVEGFRVRHFQDFSGLRIVMAAGRPVGTLGAVIGASIEITRR